MESQTAIQRYQREALAPRPAKGSPGSSMAPTVVPIPGSWVLALAKASLGGGGSGLGVGLELGEGLGLPKMHCPVTLSTQSEQCKQQRMRYCCMLVLCPQCAYLVRPRRSCKWSRWLYSGTSSRGLAASYLPGYPSSFPQGIGAKLQVPSPLHVSAPQHQRTCTENRIKPLTPECDDNHVIDP